MATINYPTRCPTSYKQTADPLSTAKISTMKGANKENEMTVHTMRSPMVPRPASPRNQSCRRVKALSPRTLTYISAHFRVTKQMDTYIPEASERLHFYTTERFYIYINVTQISISAVPVSHHKIFK